MSIYRFVKELWILMAWSLFVADVISTHSLVYVAEGQAIGAFLALLALMSALILVSVQPSNRQVEPKYSPLSCCLNLFDVERASRWGEAAFVVFYIAVLGVLLATQAPWVVALLTNALLVLCNRQAAHFIDALRLSNAQH